MNHSKTSSRAFSKTARLFGLGALLAGVVGCVDGPGVDDERADAIEATDEASLALLPNNCSDRAKNIWRAAGLMATYIPGVGNAASAGISLLAALQSGRCSQNQAEFLTMDQIRAQITSISGQVVDEALRKQLVQSADTLLRLLEPYQDELVDIDALTVAQRAQLSKDLENLAIHAVFLEADTANLNWPILPVYVQFASLKLGMYQLAYELREPGPERDNLEDMLASERQASIDILVGHETRFVTRGQTLKRSYYFNGNRFWIDTKVTNGSDTVVLVDWYCERSAFQPNGCSNRFDRRNQFFLEARNKFRDLRTKQNTVIDSNYLAFKNALFNTQAPAFKLESGRNNYRNVVTSALSPRVCLSASPEGTFSVPVCGADDDVSNADLLFGLIPTTGQLYSLGQKVCLQADDAGVLSSGPCEEVAPPEPNLDGSPAAPPSRQSWGHHPNGYFIHLATGLCLNLDQDIVMPENQQVKSVPGAGVVLSPCDFGSVGYQEHNVIYSGGESVTNDLGEDVWRVLPTTITDWQVE
ncbi:hypothetical protein [Polyangium sorediatum]|uniref:Ricin B lectin domain-containing protein n=1 Tax=Polyangium sorediatum TaxID=889274 RepID=A0ABT6NWX5_9BACT|nr:hypothetical protein [Polyangium sorediatum]MDI1432850.1 hypothetical protein [Polyangium sorediatum]